MLNNNFMIIILITFAHVVNIACSPQEVEETPSKRGRRGKEPAMNRSPSLQRGKSSMENSPRIMFTGLVDKQGEKVSSFLIFCKIHYDCGTSVSCLDLGACVLN